MIRHAGLTKSLLLATVCIARIAGADTIILKNGSRLQGDLKKTADGWNITSADGKTTAVKTDEIKSVEAGGGKSSAQSQGLLQSLRRSVENVNDIKQIVERYKRFIELNSDNSAGEDAKKDLAEWQNRLDRGFVKSGNKWVSPQDRDAIAGRATEEAVKARDLIMQGRTRDAETIIQQTLDVDPNNIAALYLRGVLQWRQDLIGPAKKTFETLNTLIADHAPTLNNLAVILARQNQAVASAGMLDQSLLAAPLDRIIVDNAAEVLHAMPDENRKAPPVLKLLRRFTEQDTTLQQALGRQGLYRWGATWVDKTTLDRVLVAEKEIKEKLDRLNADFDAAKARRSQIAPEIQTRQDSMRQIETQSVALQPDGTVVRFPLPPYYYTLQNEIGRLRSEQAVLDTKLDGFRAQARRIQQEMPVPQYTGVLKLIDVEGAPLPPPVIPILPAPKPAASTLPATSMPATQTVAPSVQPVAPTTQRAVAATEPSTPTSAPATAPESEPLPATTSAPS